mgnify:CR=1 FL=1|tara:strand:+ start:1228 stop:1416 length:189 start_codon:yes stop_codon:yes gene_type:complete
MTDSRETLGWCQGKCGLFDHHLIDELCPSCREIIETIDTTKDGYIVGTEHSSRLSEDSNASD